MRSSVVIVGAGPSGAAAAISLAQRGIRDVVLLDKDEFPRDKTCGSGLSPNALAVLDELGIGAAVREKGYPISGCRFITPGNREMVLAGDAVAMILLRKHFDNLLVERAKELGATFLGGFHARELIAERGRAIGVRARDGREVRGDYLVCADGAHSIFSTDPRPKKTISTLMGWWEGFPIEPHTLEMVFDKNLAPLYGWMFPEGDDRVNIGICMDGEDPSGRKTTRNVREVFQRFLDDHYASRLKNARQIGKLKGHPISFTTWVDHAWQPGVLQIGEAARMTHNATGEGIFQAMQSGIFAAEALAGILQGRQSEADAIKRYTWACRKRFTVGFLVGHAVRGLVRTPLLDGVAALYNKPEVRAVVTRVLASALAGSAVSARRAPETDPAARRAPAQASEIAVTG